MPLPYPWNKVKDPLALPAGFLRTEIAIQAPSSTQDASGGAVSSWTPVLAAMAGVESITATEIFQTSQYTSEATHRITLRWPGELGIRPGMRVLVGSAIYLVQAYENVLQRNRVLRLMCVEIDGVS